MFFFFSGNSFPTYMEWEPEQPSLFVLPGDDGTKMKNQNNILLKDGNKTTKH
jgi:hypothetical protein